MTQKIEQRRSAVGPPLNQIGTDDGEAERKERQCGVMEEEWDE
jgi:hypothetical protein